MGLKIIENTIKAVSVLAVTAFLSCSRTEYDIRGGQPIRFSTNEVVTKSGSYFSAGDKIGVFAYYLPGGLWDGTAMPDFMYNVPLTLDNSEKWDYSPQMYWPSMTENQIRFYSYYPYLGMLDEGELSISEAKAPGSPVLGFNMTDGKTDFLVSEPLQMSRPDMGEEVELPLKHSLGKVQFKFSVSSSGGFSFINAVKLYGIASKGILKWNESDEFFWETDGTFDLTIPSAGKDGFRVNDTELTLADEFTSYILPGAITHLGIFQNGVEKKYELSSVAAITGRVLVFTFKVSLSGVTIDSEIVPWVDGGTSIGGIR